MDMLLMILIIIVINVINDPHGEEITGTFYDKELQKKQINKDSQQKK